MEKLRSSKKAILFREHGKYFPVEMMPVLHTTLNRVCASLQIHPLYPTLLSAPIFTDLYGSLLWLHVGLGQQDKRRECEGR